MLTSKGAHYVRATPVSYILSLHRRVGQANSVNRQQVGRELQGLCTGIV
jgi:hypothetical protein